MFQVSDSEIENRLKLDNPWWSFGGAIEAEVASYPRRAYLNEFVGLVANMAVRRAVVLLGPRRVGKTILVNHCIDRLINAQQLHGAQILYVSLEVPIYTGLSLEQLLAFYMRLQPGLEGHPRYVFFDEIQYLKNWEQHLKVLVDTYRDIKFVATGSAAAALKAQSAESGAGRFTEFSLPPLTFAEYLRFIDRESQLIEPCSKNGKITYEAVSLTDLNAEFINYLNYGGYPEVVLSQAARSNPKRFIKSDIIDKVLMRDLPGLYGIADIQELNSLFNMLAYNTGQEVSPEGLSKSANVSKITLSKYMDYLEAAFLIYRVKRVSEDAKHFKRNTTFKVYLTNPTMRAALFSPVTDSHEAIGHVAETAVFGQWLHNVNYVDSLYYARWKKGEIDLVSLDPRQKPRFAIEVKWSDMHYKDHSKLKGLAEFAKTHTLERPPLVTTKTITGRAKVHGVDMDFAPCALHCYTVAKNSLERSGGSVA